MKLIDIKIDGFGKLNDRYIGFDEGINLVTGHNEAGKSTLHACIRAMFYGMERAKGVAALTDEFSRFKPWKGNKYGAVMRIENEGQIYAIIRDFYKDPVGCTVYNETSQEAVPFAEGFLRDALCGMTEIAYDNTISIGQLRSSAEDAVAAELKKYIINMGTTGNRSLNCEEAKKYLADQKRSLAEDIVPSAARTMAANAGEIKNIEKEIDAPEYISRINELEDEKKAAEQILREKTAEANALCEGIHTDREKLKETGSETSGKAVNDEKNFQTVLNEYREEVSSNAVARNRVIYIVFLGFALLCACGAIYCYVTKAFADYIIFCAAGCITGLIPGIIFLVLCISAKNRLGKKKQALSGLLKKHIGSGEIADSAIRKVKTKLEQTKELAFDVEKREKQLEDLNRENDIMTDRNNELDSNIIIQKQTQSELMEKLNRLNTLRRENEELAAAIERNDKINDDIEAIDIAAGTIDELAARLKDSLGVFLNKEASGYINRITGGAYDSISIDDSMEVFINTSEKTVPLEQLSSGTSDQVYMALRLAGARLVQQDGDRLPLILDDSFVNYDGERLTSTLKWIADEYKGQIIIFSCHNREKKIMENEEIRFRNIEL